MHETAVNIIVPEAEDSVITEEVSAPENNDEVEVIEEALDDVVEQEMVESAITANVIEKLEEKSWQENQTTQLATLISMTESQTAAIQTGLTTLTSSIQELVTMLSKPPTQEPNPKSVEVESPEPPPVPEPPAKRTRRWV